jgi:ubiquinone/menaquinone biosynthesis C-methylase UbiE
VSAAANDQAWETAYLRFESFEEETRKFRERLRRIGAAGWSRESRTVELFCGRGSGLSALGQLGFSRVSGIDLSLALLLRSRGAANLLAGDCRTLPYASESHEMAIVQGGLHHLARLPQDLDLTLSEARRILKPDGRFVAVEPWMSPFLRLAHALSQNRLLRRVWKKGDALAVMIENERETYERWLAAPELILERLRSVFRQEFCRVFLGKLYYVGRR